MHSHFKIIYEKKIHTNAFELFIPKSLFEILFSEITTFTFSSQTHIQSFIFTLIT